MPHQNTWEAQGLYRQFTGIISGDEILTSNFDTHTQDDFLRIQYIINDFTQADGHSIDISHTHAYASSDKVIANSKGALKIAIVVNQPEMIALAENYIKLMQASPFNCQLFHTLEDARHWIKTHAR